MVGSGSEGLALALTQPFDVVLLDLMLPGRNGREVCRALREQSAVPVFLAGGLNAGNIREAIAAVAPFGVELCSGVRVGGKLDADKLSAFMRAVKDSV